jgi:hypothetical protein
VAQDSFFMVYDAVLRGKRISTFRPSVDAGRYTLIPSRVRCCSFQLNVRSSLNDLFLIMMEQNMLSPKIIEGQRRTFTLGWAAGYTSQV